MENPQEHITLQPEEDDVKTKINKIKEHISRKHKEIRHLESLIEQAKKEIHQCNHKLYRICKHEKTHFEHEIYDRWTVCDDCGLTLSPYMY